MISGKTATVSLTAIQPTGPPESRRRAPGRLRWDTGQPRLAVGRESDVEPPIERRFGPHLKDVAIAPQGDLAVFNAMNWDENLYALDLASGAVRWRQRLGNHFTYAPQTTAQGFAVEAFDRTTAEGYHLYLLDRDGKAERRFALYGLPKRSTTGRWGQSRRPHGQLCRVP